MLQEIFQSLGGRYPAAFWIAAIGNLLFVGRRKKFFVKPKRYGDTQKRRKINNKKGGKNEKQRNDWDNLDSKGRPQYRKETLSRYGSNPFLQRKGKIKHGEMLRIYVTIDGDILTKVEKYVSKSESEITTGGADFVLLRIFPQIHLLSRTERREKW